ncbi:MULTISPECIES: cellulose-binding protein [unclassified Streptomyces]|uniref:cellulose-binding protein n=1 Tax=unclassified Streptomyces TaxID=2593676 RepID=UPI0033B306AD
MGFAVGRGRSYRPEQVDRFLAALSAERDGARERAVLLTALVAEREKELAGLRALVEELPPQRYESLGERARKILEFAEAEDEALVRAAEADAQALAEATDAAAREAAESARAYAEGVREAAEAKARATLETARGRAEELTTEAGREAEELRTAAREAFEEVERRAAELLAEQAAEQKTVREEAGREEEARAAELDARHEELFGRAEARLAEAGRFLSETEEQARHGQEDADAKASELLAQARLKAERTERATERVLREHEEARDEIHSHMEHIRDSLAALTGRGPAEEAERSPARGAGTGTDLGSASGADPGSASAPAPAPDSGQDEDPGPETAPGDR